MICKKCNKQFPVSMVINGKRHNLNHRKYCIECSPFNKHNTAQLHSGNTNKDIYGNKIIPTERICTICKITKPSTSFYLRRNNSELTAVCKDCKVHSITLYRREIKQKAIEYKGGSCEKCGYNKCDAALDFHHIDPTQKEFSISQAKTKRFEYIKQELDKCILICNRCHVELHNL